MLFGAVGDRAHAFLQRDVLGVDALDAGEARVLLLGAVDVAARVVRQQIEDVLDFERVKRLDFLRPDALEDADVNLAELFERSRHYSMESR